MEPLKLILAVALIVASIFIIADWRIKWLFWIGIILMFCRRLDFPIIGEFEPSTIVLCLAALLVIHTVIENLLFRYPLQLFVLAFGICNAYMLGNQGSETWTWTVAIFVVFLFSALTEVFIRSKMDIETLSSIFIIISFVIAFTGIMGYVGLADGYVILKDSSVESVDGETIYSKTYGIAYDNTVLGYVPIALIFLSGKKWRKLFKIIISLSIVIAVLISLKRLAYISLLLSFVYIVLTQAKKIRLLLLLAGVFVFVVGTRYFGDSIISRFQDVTNILGGDESPDLKRASRIDYATHAIREHPFLGNGSGDLVFIHNGYLEMVGNLGLLALVVFIPWLFRPARILFSSSDLQQKNWAAGCLIFLMTVFLLEAALGRFELMWIFALLHAGFARSLQIYSKKQPDPIAWNKEKLAFL